LKVGIFGGSFDPVHYGHLIIAEHVLEQLKLDRIVFIPAAQSPHKKNPPVAMAKQRVEMLQLAIAGHANFEISTIELDRGGISYTVDTLEALTSQFPDASFYLIVGADSIEHFDKWKSPDRIVSLSRLVVCNRGGFGNPDYSALSKLASQEQIAEIQKNSAQCPLIEISSSTIRSRVAQGRSIRFQTPRAVEKYIQTNNLYAQAHQDD
jgi:nicotinate-nucleotide adenylyltransferase